MTDTEAKALALVNEHALNRRDDLLDAKTSELHCALLDAVQAQAATEARHAAEMRELKERFGEVALLVDGDLEVLGFAKTSPTRSRLTPFILPAPDPLVEDEDPIDALVDLLAPVLTHSQGMAARERENRFRNAIAAIRAQQKAPTHD